jgi:hypothetical protein
MTVSRLRLAAASITGAACALVVGVPAGVADAGSHASCIGIEASSVSPPGSSDEFPGGVPQIVTVVKDAAGKYGPVISTVAKLHEGSHEACDEATEG